MDRRGFLAEVTLLTAGAMAGATGSATGTGTAGARLRRESRGSKDLVEFSNGDRGTSGNEMVSLLDQLRCERGVRVADPDGADAGILYPDSRYEVTSQENRSDEDEKNGTDRKNEADGTLRRTVVHSAPAWRLCQWASRFNLAGATRLISNDAFGPFAQFSDSSKSIALRLNDDGNNGNSGGSEQNAGNERSGGFDLRIELNGQVEYEHRMPRAGQAWPHLLLERNLLMKPVLSELSEVRLRIDFRIPIHEREPELVGWDDGLHTAQFLAYLTIQNLWQDVKNKESGESERGKGNGDYLWFGVPMFDIRHRQAPRYVALDFSTAEKAGTGKMIFSPGGAEYFDADPHMGEWVTIDRNVLPLLREALQTAWDRGYLADSRVMGDYHLSMMNIGWEITAPIRGVAEVRNMALIYR